MGKKKCEFGELMTHVLIIFLFGVYIGFSLSSIR